MSMLTVKDIFDLTPKPHEIIDGCQWRFHAFDVSDVPKDQCLKLFNILKYLGGRSICYQFSPRHPEMKYDRKIISSSFAAMGEIYDIWLNKSLTTKAGIVRVISFLTDHQHPEDYTKVPTSSHRFRSLIYRYDHNLKIVNDMNFIQIKSDEFIVKRLPYPFDEGCTNDFKKFNVLCIRNCSIEVYKDHGLVPSDELILEPIPRRHFSFKDMDNETLVTKISEGYNQCTKKCRLWPCQDSYSITSTQMSSVPGERILLSSICSQSPSYILTFIPKMNTFEFIFYLCACFGIWLGVSFYSLNMFQSKYLNYVFCKDDVFKERNRRERLQIRRLGS
jgi:hypothetical protein